MRTKRKVVVMISIITVLLGHVSINSTAFYTRPDGEDVARAMEEAS